MIPVQVGHFCFSVRSAPTRSLSSQRATASAKLTTYFDLRWLCCRLAALEHAPEEFVAKPEWIRLLS